MALSLRLVGQYLREGDARSVVDADMNELPAHAATVGLAGAIAGDAVANPFKSPELLDVDVDHVAGMLAFVAADRLGLVPKSSLQTRQPCTPENPTDGGGRDADLHGDVLAGQPLAAQVRQCAAATGLASQTTGMTLGRDERSPMPLLPSVL